MIHHVIMPTDEVLQVAAATNGALIDDHETHLVRRVKHRGRSWFLVDAHHVIIEAFVVIDSLRPARITGTRWEEARIGIVGIAFAPTIINAIVVRALQIVATEVHPHAIQVPVLSLRDLTEAEAIPFAVQRLIAITEHKGEHVQLGTVATDVGHVRPPVRTGSQAPMDRADRHRSGGIGSYRDLRAGQAWIIPGRAVPGGKAASERERLSAAGGIAN